MSIRAEPAWRFPARARPHWVVAELDASGMIDRHAAMCLRHGIEGALAGTARAILVDLRDLTAIDASGLAPLVCAHADCYAHGVELELLISGRASQYAIADALDSAGLLDQLCSTSDCGVPIPRRLRLVHQPAPAGRGERLRAAAGRLARRHRAD